MSRYPRKSSPRRHSNKKKMIRKRKAVKTLRDRIREMEPIKLRCSTPEEIIDDLRSDYPDDYHRKGTQTLKPLVRKTLHSIIRNDNHNDVESRSVSKKRRMIIDEDKEEENEEEKFEEEAEEDKEDRLQTTSTSCDSVMGLSGTESNGGMSEDEEKDVKVRNKEELGFEYLGGMKDIFEELKPDLLLLRYPELCTGLGVKPIGGILLHGLPGCGKTTLAKAIAHELGFNFYSKSATDFVSGVLGASEENIRKLFSEAKKTAPSVVFIDEIDAIASKRENLQRQMETRIVTQLMVCMDEANNDSGTSDDELPHVLVIGATNKPASIDPALRRPGRFDREILIGIPNESAREEILTVATRGQKHDGLIDLRKIAKLTPGFVGADLKAVVNKVGSVAVKRMLDEGLLKEPFLPQDINKCAENGAIIMSDFEKAAKGVQPSLRREGFDSIPNVKWEDVGALDLIREELDFYITRRIKYPEEDEGHGMNLDTGFLLYGPPGCGKTLIAQAVANEAGANFIYVHGPEILDKLVGESERKVRTIFTRARTSEPCIIFFDEVDALTSKRGSREGGQVIEGVLNQLLVELDGAKKRKDVFVIGATNRPEVMDSAILRPGRFGIHIYVPLPSPDDRGKILKTLAKGKPIDASVDLSAIGRMKECENFSGADLDALIKKAYRVAFKEKLVSTEKTSGIMNIKKSHFKVALRKVYPSVSAKQRQYYRRISKSLNAT